MVKLRPIAAALTLVGLSACAPIDFDPRPHSGLSAEPARSRFGAYVMLTPDPFCPSDIDLSSGPRGLVAGVAQAGPLAPFGAPLAGSVANIMVDSALTLVQRQQDRLSGAFGAGGVVDLGSVRGARCLVIVRGHIGDGGPETDRSAGPLTPEHLEELGLIDIPSFYAEIRVLPTRAIDVYRFAPHFIAYAESVAVNKGSGRKVVDITLIASLDSRNDGVRTPGGQGPGLQIIHLPLGYLEVGSTYDRPLLRGAEVTHSFGDPILTGPISLAAIVRDAESPSALFGETVDTLENPATRGELVEAMTEALNNALQTTP